MSIIYVGGQGAGRAGDVNPLSVNFALTGGVDAAPIAGDLVLISVTIGGTGAVNPDCSISGFTALAQLNRVGSAGNTCTQCLSWKQMTGTPDTAFTVPSTSDVTFAQRWTVQVFRNVDVSTPFDVTTTTVTGPSAGRPNPAIITPLTAGAWVGISGAGAATGGQAYTAPTNFAAAWLTGTTADTIDACIGSGYWADWASGAVDPPTFTFSGGVTNADAWTAYTFALRPAATSGSVGVNVDYDEDLDMAGDYLFYQRTYAKKSATVNVLTGTAAYADVLTPKSANHQLFIQRIVLSIITHVADTYTIDDDGAGPAIATHLDVTPQAAGVPSVVVWNFGPEGYPVTKGANVDVSHSATGVANIHIEGYEKLIGPVAQASTN